MVRIVRSYCENTIMCQLLQGQRKGGQQGVKDGYLFLSTILMEVALTLCLP